MSSLRDLFVEELRDLHNAESQLVKALPRMVKAAQNVTLKHAFEEHLEQTRGHVQRIEQIFEDIAGSPKGKKCVGMEGLIAEGSELMKADGEEAVIDAGLILAAQKESDEEDADMAGGARTRRRTRFDV